MPAQAVGARLGADGPDAPGDAPSRARRERLRDGAARAHDDLDARGRAARPPTAEPRSDRAARPRARHLRRGRAARNVRALGRPSDARDRHAAAGRSTSRDGVSRALHPRRRAARSSRACRCRPTPATGEAFGDVVSGPRAMTFSDDGKLRLRRRHRQRGRAGRRRGHARRGPARPAAARSPARGHRLGRRTSSTCRSATPKTSRRSASRETAARRLGRRRRVRVPEPRERSDAGRTCGSGSSSSTRPTATSIRSPRTTGSPARAATSKGGATRSPGSSRRVRATRRRTPAACSTRASSFARPTARQVQDYWKTIDAEQGGHFNIDQPSQKPLLDALARLRQRRDPDARPPSTDADHTVRGQALADAARAGRGRVLADRVRRLPQSVPRRPTRVRATHRSI